MRPIFKKTSQPPDDQPPGNTSAPTGAQVTDNTTDQPSTDPPAVPAPTSTNIPQLAQELKDHQQQSQRLAALHDGYSLRPCYFCGSSWSFRMTKPVIIPRWHEVAADVGNQRTKTVPACEACHRERHRFDHPAFDSLSDREHRSKVIKRLLPEHVRKFWADNFLLARTRFRWFGETGERPRDVFTEDMDTVRSWRSRRFAYVDAVALARTLTTPPLPADFQQRGACKRCGVDRWIVETTEHVTGPGQTTVDGGERFNRFTKKMERVKKIVETPPQSTTSETLTCAGCRDIPDDLNGYVREFLGLAMRFTSADTYPDGRIRTITDARYDRVANNLLETLGLQTFEATGNTTPNSRVFGHWPPIDVIARRALAEFPDSSDWVGDVARDRVRRLAEGRRE